MISLALFATAALSIVFRAQVAHAAEASQLLVMKLAAERAAAEGKAAAERAAAEQRAAAAERAEARSFTDVSLPPGDENRDSSKRPALELQNIDDSLPNLHSDTAGGMQVNDQHIKHNPTACNSDGCICLSITENDVVFFGKYGSALNLFTFIKSFFK